MNSSICRRGGKEEGLKQMRERFVFGNRKDGLWGDALSSPTEFQRVSLTEGGRVAEF